MSISYHFTNSIDKLFYADVNKGADWFHKIKSGIISYEAQNKTVYKVDCLPFFITDH